MSLRWGAIAAVTLFFLYGAVDADESPSMSAKKDAVLQRLRELTANRNELLLGQNIGHANSFGAREWETLKRLQVLSPRRPAVGILGVDYAWGQPRRATLPRVNRLLAEHWNAGGFVTISVHFPNPLGSGDSPHGGPHVSVAELMQPDGMTHLRFARDLDIVAAGLAELRDAGVVVLWRPLHEPNGGWFWWQPVPAKTNFPAVFRNADRELKNAADSYIRLWRWMHDYLTRERGLDNLLWVYSANSQAGDGVWPAEAFYPGDEYVDVVGIDVYTDLFSETQLNAGGGFARLAALGKPIGITEIGSLDRRGAFDNMKMIDGVLKHCPQAAFIVVWHSWEEDGERRRVAIPDNRGAEELLSHPAVVSPRLEWATPK